MVHQFRIHFMKTRSFCLALILAPLMAKGATYTANLAIGQLRAANGTVIADGGGVWAVIVAGSPGSPPTSGSLPGGLTDGSSLTNANLSQINADFDSVTLTAGSYLGFTIHQVGAFTSGNDAGFDGIATAAVAFPVVDGAVPGYATGTLWGIYWFPGKSEGDTLSGTYEIGGFADSLTNTASGGEAGTSITASGATNAVLFYESGFNEGALSGGPTGLNATRFTAVAIPEPSTLSLLALASIGLILRRRF